MKRDYSGQLRKPEAVARITAIVKGVAGASGVRSIDVLFPPEAMRARVSKLRGAIGHEMLAAGFRKRDVCELFSQSYPTTDSQILKHAARLGMKEGVVS